MNRERGFSLVELMIAVAIGGFVLGTLYSIQQSHQKMYAGQGQTHTMQQNLRGGLCFLERGIRMAGYDPRKTGAFGIHDVRSDSAGNGTITFSLDDNMNNTTDQNDGNGVLDNLETFSFLLYDYPTASPDGDLDLGRKYGGKRELLAENIDALGFAFAFDRNNDGDNALDRDINGNVIWAVDTDGDKMLDTNLDTDNDGDIDVNDHPGGTPLSHPDNGMLPNIMLSDIRAVHVWLLAVDRNHESLAFSNRNHVVSSQRITSHDGFPRKVMTSIVRCRNMGLKPNN